MKTTILALFCLLACGTAYAKHGNVGNLNHTEVGTSVLESWIVKIVKEGSDSALITMEYDVKFNILVFINHERNWAVVVEGATGDVAWFNLNVSAGILVNTKEGNGTLFTNSTISALASNGPIDVFTATAVFVRLIRRNKSNTFDIRCAEIAEAVFKNPDADITQFFPTVAQYDEYLSLFGQFLNETRENVKNRSANSKLGIFWFILPVFDGALSCGKPIVDVLDANNVKTGGTFDANFTGVIYNDLKERK